MNSIVQNLSYLGVTPRGARTYQQNIDISLMLLECSAFFIEQLQQATVVVLICVSGRNSYMATMALTLCI